MWLSSTNNAIFDVEITDASTVQPDRNRDVYLPVQFTIRLRTVVALPLISDLFGDIY